ncbi:MAG TPA: hypothetical protein VHY20_13090, partial [Pirellulales bacterium]|nr:hypothetical protein [Pirellulales bacterium]
MNWLETLLDELADPRCWAYAPGAPPATEPTALAALALHGHGHAQAAQQAGDLLVERQGSDGSLGINSAEHAPHWATS